MRITLEFEHDDPQGLAFLRSLAGPHERKKVPAGFTKAEPEPEPVEVLVEEPEMQVTQEEVKDLAKQLIDAGKREELKGVLEIFEVSTISKIADEDLTKAYLLMEGCLK